MWCAGLKRAELDPEDLGGLGLNAGHAGRVYQMFFVYTMGFTEGLEKVVVHCDSHNRGVNLPLTCHPEGKVRGIGTGLLQ